MENNINIPEINNSINKINNNDYVQNNVKILEEYILLLENKYSIKKFVIDFSSTLDDFNDVINKTFESNLIRFQELNNLFNKLQKYNQAQNLFKYIIKDESYLSYIDKLQTLLITLKCYINNINNDMKEFLKTNIYSLDKHQDIENIIKDLEKELLSNEEIVLNSQLTEKINISFKKNLQNKFEKIIDEINTIKNENHINDEMITNKINIFFEENLLDNNKDIKIDIIHQLKKQLLSYNKIVLNVPLRFRLKTASENKPNNFINEFKIIINKINDIKNEKINNLFENTEFKSLTNQINEIYKNSNLYVKYRFKF